MSTHGQILFKCVSRISNDKILFMEFVSTMFIRERFCIGWKELLPAKRI